ncbi:MAG: IS1634 family transposase, partial [Brevinematia bacterium]
MEEVNRYNYGFVAFAKLWNMLGISKMLNKVIEGKKIEFDFSRIVFSMVVNRLLEPSSKLYHYNHKDRYLFVNEEIELHNIYRSLDLLAENKEEIEFKLFEKERSLFNLKLDIVFYDVTTFYFESVKSDDIRDFGFSKDNKVNEVQVVMGLLIDREGRPIGYELFRGNTIDSKTMINVIKKLKEKFMIDRIIFVADKGLNSKINLKELKENGFDYIVSGRLRQMPENIQKSVLNREGYKACVGYEYKELEYTNLVSYTDENGKKHTKAMEEKLICTYSSERALKDRADRERLIEKAK